MAFWLLKSEPVKWSWDMQMAAGEKGTFWDGVRNHTAKLNLMKMRLGDGVFFYHSNEGLAIVGTMEVIREAYPDPTAEAGEPWVVVDVKARSSFPRPVGLAEIKQVPALAKMSLITSFRLSVQPVTEEEWQIITQLGGLTD